MNCHDHLYAWSNPQVNSRRWFLKECGLGLGKLAHRCAAAEGVWREHRRR